MPPLLHKTKENDDCLMLQEPCEVDKAGILSAFFTQGNRSTGENIGGLKGYLVSFISTHKKYFSELDG